jgi:cytidylate kinase
VDYRVLTVSREFGSGGGRIAKFVAERLGWRLIDRELIEAIACSAHVDPRVVTRFDERAESWMGRMNRRAMRGAALAAGVAPEEENCFDPDVMKEMTRKIVEQAHDDGDCVIVGRGAQCILQQTEGYVSCVCVRAVLRSRLPTADQAWVGCKHRGTDSRGGWGAGALFAADFWEGLEQSSFVRSDDFFAGR